jgi:hypothetical protein
MLKNYISTALTNKVLIGFFAVCTACTPWHMSKSVMDSDCKQISIPYVQNDEDGELTAYLVQAVSEQPGFRVDNGGRYLLSVKLLDRKESKLGFRYNPIELRKGEKELILNETRAKALAEVKIVDRFTNEIIRGPAYILGSIEYDHQESSVNNDINRLSLGQLCDIDTAEDVVYIPLYRDLAAKIGLWLQNNSDFAQEATAQGVP